MIMASRFDSGESVSISEEVAVASGDGRPVVALESAILTHGLPRPVNLETARACEAAIRAAGAVPATIALIRGLPTIGLTDQQLQELAVDPSAKKASRRDLGWLAAQKQNAGTTVSATMLLAHRAGIRVFATGGIGGAHRPPAPAFDISADLVELGRTPVLVVCAGAKSILDLPRTLEILETLGVPVIGFCTDFFPEFYTAGGTNLASGRVETAEEAAAAFRAHLAFAGAGTILANPISPEFAIPAAEFAEALCQAESESTATGAKLTPDLLSRLASILGPRALTANRELVVANAKLAAEVAVALGKMDGPTHGE